LIKRNLGDELHGKTANSRKRDMLSPRGVLCLRR
jgi:hypothetical protein